MHLTNKLAVVTGSAQGIGLAISKSLSEEGAKLLMVDRNPEIEETALAHNADSLVCDLGNPESATEIADFAQSKGGCEILVNNAGISLPGAMDSIRDKDWSTVMSINLDAAFRLSRTLWQQLASHNGCIVNIASFASKRATLFGNNASYTVSKHGIAGLTRAAAMDGASSGIRVNAVAPGVVNTDLVKLHDEATRNKIQQMIPLGKYADPEEIAKVVTFLASSCASHMTGEVVNVNGGLVMD